IVVTESRKRATPDLKPQFICAQIAEDPVVLDLRPVRDPHLVVCTGERKRLQPGMCRRELNTRSNARHLDICLVENGRVEIKEDSRRSLIRVAHAVAVGSRIRKHRVRYGMIQPSLSERSGSLSRSSFTPARILDRSSAVAVMK
ncbi:MAG: hypothetical protein QOF79_1665, partial [Actinomycetota bacterium]|nr:hypothetical protein [Actinomycetota bacterium]